MKKNKGNRGLEKEPHIKKLLRAKLICWYGFRNEIAEFAMVTLVNGLNMSGKTTLLDAIKYALYGDDQFNISASSTGGSKSRVISSYTECLLSKGISARSGMIYSHIAVEFYDTETGKFFVCDTMIITDASTHKHKTYRILFEDSRIEDIVFYEEDPEKGKISLDEKKFSAKNGQARLMKPTEGLEKFSDAMGLKLNSQGLAAFRGRMRGLINYDPDDNIPTLIKKGILEERPASIEKLKNAKKSYKETGEVLKRIEEENNLLDEILTAAESYESLSERVTKEEIKYDYKAYRDALGRLESAAREIDLDIRRQDDLTLRKKEAERRSKEANDRLTDAKAAHNSVLSAYKVDEQKRVVDRCSDAVEAAQRGMEKIVNLCADLKYSKDVIRGITPEEEALTEDIATTKLSKGLKESLLISLQEKALDSEAELDADRFEAKRNLEHLRTEETELKEELRQIENRTHIPGPGMAGKALRDEINKALVASGYEPAAKMAYEYVDSILDEEWRFAIEARLGKRRFAVIVPLEFYDFGYNVQLRTGNRNATLVRTSEILNKDIRVHSGELATMLDVSNPVARKYFDYYLRYVMTEPENVRDHDHAIAKNGFYSDVTYTGYLGMSSSDRFCLGYKAGAASAEMIRARLDDLDGLKMHARDELESSSGKHKKARRVSETVRTLLDGDLDLAAGETLAKAKEIYKKESERCVQMLEEMSKDPEAIELEAKVLAAEKEAADIMDELGQINGELSTLGAIIEKHREMRDAAEAELEGNSDAYDEEENIGLSQIMEDHKAFHEKEALAAMKEYDDFLASGKEGTGVLSKRRMQEYRAAQSHAAEELARGQALYCDKYYPLGRGADVIEPYRARKAKVEVTELEKAKATYLLRRKNCFKLFNTEFLLFIRECVEDAMKEMRALNESLANAGFKTKYKLEFREIRDGTMIEDILVQSKRRAAYGDRLTDSAQMSLADIPATSDSDGERELSESEMEDLMDRLINAEDGSKYEDYRNYLDYDVILEGDGYPEGGARLTEENGGNSGAGRQIPYTIILTCGLLNLYNRRKSCARLLFMDEPFKTLDAANVDVMIDFFKEQNLQVVFVAGNKDDEIGPHCDMITPVISGNDKSDMRIGKIRRKTVS